MSQTKKWEGRSKGGLTGLRIFVFILKIFGLRTAYFFIRFVALYYLLFSGSRKFITSYFKKVHGYGSAKAFWESYCNFCVFGEVLIDKIAVLSNTKNRLSIEKEDFEENLNAAKNHERGGILLSAHVGNWEIAGQKLGGHGIKFNVLMYDNEVAPMKAYMDSVTGHKFNVIAIKDDLSHLVELHRAFNNKELLVMHGDRYLPGAETITRNFFGRPAKFPLGPFIMAAKFGVPITPVFAFKDSSSIYRFYAKKAIEVKRSRNKAEQAAFIDLAADQYIAELEKMLLKYPRQWFNYYEFWGE